MRRGRLLPAVLRGGCFGSLSDHLGRRGLIIAALIVGAAGCAVFLLAHGVALLFAARAVQGVAVGLAAGALGAELIELQPKGSGLGPLLASSVPNLGLAVGALATSALNQYTERQPTWFGGCFSVRSSWVSSQ